jgi:hypothetical protein
MNTLIDRLMSGDQTAAKEAAVYLHSLQGLGNAIRKLHQVASDSLINDPLDEGMKGHRLGTIEVCEALLRVF